MNKVNNLPSPKTQSYKARYEARQVKNGNPCYQSRVDVVKRRYFTEDDYTELAEKNKGDEVQR